MCAIITRAKGNKLNWGKLWLVSVPVCVCVCMWECVGVSEFALSVIALCLWPGTWTIFSKFLNLRIINDKAQIVSKKIHAT